MDKQLQALDDPEKVHQAILETIKVMEYSVLYLGLALVKIKTEKLYRDLGYKHMSAYVQGLVEESQKDRSSIYKWLNIGEVYTKYQGKLEEIGFSSKNSPTKLPYLERALQKSPSNEVYDNIMKMSQREFASYAKHSRDAKHSSDAKHSTFAKSGDFDMGNSSVSRETENNAEGLPAEITEKTDEWGYSFTYRDKIAVKVNNTLSKRALRMILPSVRLALNALARRGYVVAVHLDNYREYRSFEKIAIEAREKMRTQLRATSSRTAIGREKMEAAPKRI